MSSYFSFRKDILGVSVATPGVDCLLRVCRRDKSDPESQQRYFHVEKTRINGPVIKVQMNGMPTRVLLDTGSSTSIIQERLADRLGGKREQVLLPDGRPPVLFPGDPPVEGLRVGEVKFGIFSTPRSPFLVIPDRRADFFRESGCDAIFGLNRLLKHAMMLDFERREITIWYPGALTEAEIRMLGYQPANFTPILPVNCINLKLNGEVEVPTLLDTGAEFTEIPLQTAEALKLDPVRRAVPSRTVYGIEKTNRALVNLLAIGPEVLAGVMVAYPAELTPKA